MTDCADRAVTVLQTLPAHSNRGRVESVLSPEGMHTTQPSSANTVVRRDDCCSSTAHSLTRSLTEMHPGAAHLARTLPALDAANALLADGDWHRWTDVVAAMIYHSDLLPVPASNRLHELVQHGALQRRGRHPDRWLRRPPALDAQPRPKGTR